MAAAVPVALAVGGYVLTRGDGPSPPTVQAEVSTPTAPTPEPEQAPAATPADESVAPEPAPEAPATAAPTELPNEESVGWKLDLTPSEDIQAALAQSTNVHFEDIHLKDVLEFVQDSFTLNVVLDSRVVAPPADRRPSWPSERYITDGYIRLVNQRDVPLEKTLVAALTPLNLTYKARGRTLWISSSRQITQDLTVPLPSAPFREGEMLEKLASPANIEFEDIHISDVFDFLSRSFRIPVHLDHTVVAPEPKQGDPPLEDLGPYATDGMIPYINLKNVSTGETLYILTRLLDLTYRVDRDAIYVSTPDRVHHDF